MKIDINTVIIMLDKSGIDHRSTVKNEGHYEVFSISVLPKDVRRTHSVLNRLLDPDQFYEVLDNL